jgi:hypothetical protein
MKAHVWMVRIVCNALILGTLLLAQDAAGDQAAKPRLILTRGTMQAGGTLGATLQTVKPEHADAQFGALLNISPEFSYFVMDKLSLGAAISVGLGFGDLYKNTPKTIAFGIGAKYHFDLGRVVPYVGLMFGPLVIIDADAADQKQVATPVDYESNTTKSYALSSSDTSVSLAFAVPLGVLIALNDRVALDLGVSPTVSFSVSGPNKATIFSVPIGYLGVVGSF